MSLAFRLVLFALICLAIGMCTGCATFSPQTYALPGHPGWVVKESAIPLKGFPDDPTTQAAAECATHQPWPGQQKGPPPPPCGMTDATTDCSTKTVRIWWYSRPGALDHELEHVRACQVR
jgi:hypothetical protein